MMTGHFLTATVQETSISRYQNVSILDFIEAKYEGGGGGDKWSYKMCEVPVKSSPPTNQHPTLYMADVLPVAQPTVSVPEHQREKVSHSTTFQPTLAKKYHDLHSIVQ